MRSLQRATKRPVAGSVRRWSARSARTTSSMSSTTPRARASATRRCSAAGGSSAASRADARLSGHGRAADEPAHLCPGRRTNQPSPCRVADEPGPTGTGRADEPALTCQAGEGWLRLARLDGPDAAGLQALRALGELELHSLVLLQAAEAGALDFRVVHEHVRTAVTGDEAEALLRVEPLHGALFHTVSSMSWSGGCGCPLGSSSRRTPLQLPRECQLQRFARSTPTQKLRPCTFNHDPRQFVP